MVDHYKQLIKDIQERAGNQIAVLSMYKAITSAIAKGEGMPKSLSIGKVDNIVADPLKHGGKFTHIITSSNSISNYGMAMIAISGSEIYFGLNIDNGVEFDLLKSYTYNVRCLKTPKDTKPVKHMDHVFASCMVRFELPKWVGVADVLRMNDYEESVQDGCNVYKTTHRVFGSQVEYWIDEDTQSAFMTNPAYPDRWEDLDNWIGDENYTGEFGMTEAYREMDYLRRKLIWETSQQQEVKGVV